MVGAPRSRIRLLVGLMAALAGTGVPLRSASALVPLEVHVELVEQAACLVSHDRYRVLFDVRTIYVNAGRTPVSIGTGTERIVAASFAPAWNTAAVLSFGGLAVSDADQPLAFVTVQSGGAGSGRASVWLPLTTGSDATSLAPGAYTARFELSLMLTDAVSGVQRPPAVRVSTAPLAVTVHPPTQVQECGDGWRLEAS